MVDGRHFEKKAINRRTSATARPIVTKFVTVTHDRPFTLLAFKNLNF